MTGVRVAVSCDVCNLAACVRQAPAALLSSAPQPCPFISWSSLAIGTLLQPTRTAPKRPSGHHQRRMQRPALTVLRAGIPSPHLQGGGPNG